MSRERYSDVQLDEIAYRIASTEVAASDLPARHKRIDSLKPLVQRDSANALAQDIAEAVIGHWIETGDKRGNRELLRSAAALAIKLSAAHQDHSRGG